MEQQEPSGSPGAPNPVVPPPTTPAPSTTVTPSGADATLEAQLLAALSQGGTGGSIGKEQNPKLIAQPTSNTPGILYIALAGAAVVIIFLLLRRKA